MVAAVAAGVRILGGGVPIFCRVQGGYRAWDVSFFTVMAAREVGREEQVDSLNECYLLALNLEASSYEDAKIDLMDAYHVHTSRFNFPHFISCLTLRDSYAHMCARTSIRSSASIGRRRRASRG